MRNFDDVTLQTQGEDVLCQDDFYLDRVLSPSLQGHPPNFSADSKRLERSLVTFKSNRSHFRRSTQTQYKLQLLDV